MGLGKEMQDRIYQSLDEAYGQVGYFQDQVVIVDDVLPDVLVNDIIISTDLNSCDAQVSLSQPIVSDNCGIGTITNDYNNTSDASGLYSVGTTTITWTVTDI